MNNGTSNYLRRRSRLRADVNKFAALLASPATSMFDMPANGRIRLVATGVVTGASTIATLVSSVTRSIKSATGGMVAGDVTPLGDIERAVEITPSSKISVQLDTGLGVWKTIATVS